MSYLFSSESVSPGHPDKLCDQISDAVLDYIMSLDSECRSAIETAVTADKMMIFGEFRAKSQVSPEEIEKIARKVIKEVGYLEGRFNYHSTPIEVLLNAQSPDIAMGVDATENKEEGAGDQGIMFGFASNETENYMPATLYYSHRILENLWKEVVDGRKSKTAYNNLGSDAKSQVTLEYDDKGGVVRADSIVLSTQHSGNIDIEEVKRLVMPVIKATLPENLLDERTRFLINPTGKFVIGGPESDSGLTGRKIIVDTYGGAAPHGGGAFSGKDPTKVDRSACYMARHIAKNVVASGICNKCTIQLSYSIGVSKPVSFYLVTDTLSPADTALLSKFIQERLPLTPAGIRKYLGLNKAIYQISSTFGHFGREYDSKTGAFSWEKTDFAGEIKKGL